MIINNRKVYVRIGTSWADAMRGANSGAIADWFVWYFFLSGLVGLALAGFAAAIPDTAISAPRAVAAVSSVQAATPAPGATAANPRQGRTGGGAANPAPAAGAGGKPAAAATSHERVVTPRPSAGGTGLGLRVFGLGLLLAGACTAVGWLFGLLFGVPKSLSSAGAAAAAAPAPTIPTLGSKAASRVNTNLEDVSDWLTKTLIGVGLVEFKTLPVFLGDLARDINDYGFSWGYYGQLLALATILYFVPGGFWLGYVGTRTLLTALFNRFSDPNDSVRTAAQKDNLRNMDLGGRPANSIVSIDDQQLKDADADILSQPVDRLTTGIEIMAWAAAQARAGNYQQARTALGGILAADPKNDDVKELLAKVELALGGYADAIYLLRDAPATPTKLLASLYGPQPGSFEQALALGVLLLANDKYRNNASVHSWLACAYAQKYSYTKKQTNLADTDPALAAIKAQVLTEINTAISLDPGMRANLWDFWQPKAGSVDNDLQVFGPDDPDLKKALDPVPPATASGAAPQTNAKPAPLDPAQQPQQQQQLDPAPPGVDPNKRDLDH